MKNKAINVRLFIEVDGQKFELSEDDAMALRDKLDSMLGDKKTWYPYPYPVIQPTISPSIPWWQPQVTYCDTGNNMRYVYSAVGIVGDLIMAFSPESE